MVPTQRTYLTYSIIGIAWTMIIFFFLFLFSFFQNVSYDRSISIYTWADMIDPNIIEQFQKETGIKVYMSYFENNKELLVKLQATRGIGYDLILPSDYIVSSLIEDNLIKPIDKEKLTMLDRIHPALANCEFDPGCEHSVPYCWSIYGIGIDSTFFDPLPEPSWNLLFEQVGPKPYTVVMINEPREALSIAAQYLFGTVNALSHEQLKKIRYLMLTQKKMVEVYADALSEYYMMAHMCPVVLTNTPVVWRMIKKNPNIAFVVPREGSFMVADCFALSAATKKDDLIYTFINYMYKKEHIQHHFDTYTFFPATSDVEELFKKARVPQSIIDAHTVLTDNFTFFRPTIPEDSLQNMWLSIKSF